MFWREHLLFMWLPTKVSWTANIFGITATPLFVLLRSGVRLDLNALLVIELFGVPI